MENNASKERILSRIRKAQQPPEVMPEDLMYQDAEIYQPVGDDLLACFIRELEAVSGKCVVCANDQDLYVQLSSFVQEKGLINILSRDAELTAKLKEHKIPVTYQQQMPVDVQAGISYCESLIARTGSMLVSSGDVAGRQMIGFPPIHIVLATADQLVPFPGDALAAIKSKYGSDYPSFLSFVTGPSRTADIEKTLVLGAHGPKELVIFVRK